MPEADAAAPYLETYRSGRNELDSKSLGDFGNRIPKNLVIKPLFDTRGDCGKSQSILYIYPNIPFGIDRSTGLEYHKHVVSKTTKEESTKIFPIFICQSLGNRLICIGGELSEWSMVQHSKCCVPNGT